MASTTWPGREEGVALEVHPPALVKLSGKRRPHETIPGQSSSS